MRTAACLALPVLLLSPSVAQAAWGTTGYAGSSVLDDLYLGNHASFMEVYPSLDYRNPSYLFQFHALMALRGVFHDTIALGANGYALTDPHPAGTWKGVIQPGVSLDLVADTDFDDLYLGAGGLLRMGIQTASEMGAGFYVVPELGLALNDGEFELITGGTLQFSVWLK